MSRLGLMCEHPILVFREFPRCLNKLCVVLLAWLQVLVMLCFPLFSYAGVVGTASGMVDLKDIKPLLNMLRPSTRTLMVRITLLVGFFLCTVSRACVLIS